VDTALSSPLTEWIADKIRQEGKITFWEWMHWALYHPKLGYYARTDITRWGREGDYSTSPERSDLFAATFARFFVSLFERMGSSAPFQIVEFGAGNGKFALSVLNSIKNDYPSLFDLLQYTIVESNILAIDSSLDTLKPFRGKVRYVGPLEFEDNQSCIVFSNELLDSFCIHRVRKVDGRLKEFYVALGEDDKFEWKLGELSDDVELFCEQYLPELAEGQTVEVNPGIASFFDLLASKSMNGFVVTVDYGAEGKELYNQPERFDGTLRAYSAHQFIDDVLSDPGAYDITSTIDWGIAKAASGQHGFVVEEFQQLDRFLMRVGILDELEKRMSSAANDAERARMTTEARDMILPGGMASSFQVLVQKRG